MAFAICFKNKSGRASRYLTVRAIGADQLTARFLSFCAMIRVARSDLEQKFTGQRLADYLASGTPIRSGIFGRRWYRPRCPSDFLNNLRGNSGAGGQAGGCEFCGRAAATEHPRGERDDQGRRCARGVGRSAREATAKGCGRALDQEERGSPLRLQEPCEGGRQK